MKEYLTLLSICETCNYMGVDFLDFLRSGEKDIHAFAESRRGAGADRQPALAGSAGECARESMTTTRLRAVCPRPERVLGAGAGLGCWT